MPLSENSITLAIVTLNNIFIGGAVFMQKPILATYASSIIFSILAIPFALSTPAASQSIVFIPGFGGSKLKYDGENIYGKTYMQAIWHARKLEYNDTNNSKIKPDGIIDKINVLLPVPMFSGEQYFHLRSHAQKRFKMSVLKSTEKISLGDKKPYWIPFAYDWRRSILFNALALRDFLCGKIGNQNIVLMAHSTGGLVARTFFQKLQESTGTSKWSKCDGGNLDPVMSIRTYIEMGVPVQGTLRPVEVWERTYDLRAKVLSTVLFSRSKFEKSFGSFPSLYELLPIYKECCWRQKNARSKAHSIDFMKYKSWQSAELNRLLDKTKLSPDKLKRYLRRAATIKKAVSKKLPAHIRKRHHRIVGTNVETSRRYIARPSNRTFKTFLFGDGVVTEHSACDGKCKGAQLSDKPHEVVFSGVAVERALYYALENKTIPSNQSEPPIGVVGEWTWQGGTIELGSRIMPMNTSKVVVSIELLIAGPEITPDWMMQNFDLFTTNATRIEFTTSKVRPKLVHVGRPDMTISITQTEKARHLVRVTANLQTNQLPAGNNFFVVGLRSGHSYGDKEYPFRSKNFYIATAEELTGKGEYQ